MKNLEEIFILANFPPIYEKDFKIYNNVEKYNCFTYALQINSRSKFEKEWWNTGTISNNCPKDYYYNYYLLIKAFINDCAVLGLDCSNSSLDEKLNVETKSKFKLV